MKILIIGPAVTERSSGGVAIFDEMIRHGFCSLGDTCSVITCDLSSSDGVTVVPSKCRGKIGVVLSKRAIGRIIRAFEPQIVISSLHYSLGIRTYKRFWPNAVYIHVLHGFACPSNGKFRAWLTNFGMRIASKAADKTVSVSSLTHAINKKMFGITSDAVIPNGSNWVPTDETTQKEYDFVYVGRLFRDKEIELIANAFQIMKGKSPNLKFAVAGYGELEDKFISGPFADGSISFLGKLNQTEVRALLEKSKNFVSLNPLEPFGIVFCEAVLSGCNIVTQSTSGISAVFAKKNYMHFADAISPESLVKELATALDDYTEITFFEKEIIAKYLSYQRVAEQYKTLAYERNK